MSNLEFARAEARDTKIKLHGADAFAGMAKAGRLVAEALDLLVGRDDVPEDSSHERKRPRRFLDGKDSLRFVDFGEHTIRVRAFSFFETSLAG